MTRSRTNSAENMEIGPRERSRSPNRVDSKDDPIDEEKEWRCTNCITLNDIEKTICKKCRLARGTDKAEKFKQDWVCPDCGSNNFSRRLDCFRCHKRKPPIDPKYPNDWECPKCFGNNYSKRVDCYKCHEPKPGFFLSGKDWRCPDCGGINYSRRIDCYKCSTPKPDPRTTPAPVAAAAAPQSKDYYYYDSRSTVAAAAAPTAKTRTAYSGTYGAYSTPSATAQTTGETEGYQSTPYYGVKVDQSGYSRTETFPAPDIDPVTGESEWVCQLCGVPNFYKRYDCYRCHEPKPGLYAERAATTADMYTATAASYGHTTDMSHQQSVGTMGSYSHSEVLYTQPPPSKRFPGDWICAGCQGLNYSRRTDCYRCHAEKPESEMTKYKDDWMCPKCNGNNFSRRVDCYKCKTPKPDPTVSVSA